MKFIITACMVCNLLLEHALLDFNRPLVKSVEKYFSYFSTKTYVVGTLKNRLNETVLLSTQNVC